MSREVSPPATPHRLDSRQLDRPKRLIDTPGNGAPTAERQPARTPRPVKGLLGISTGLERSQELSPAQCRLHVYEMLRIIRSDQSRIRQRTQGCSMKELLLIIGCIAIPWGLVNTLTSPRSVSVVEQSDAEHAKFIARFTESVERNKISTEFPFNPRHQNNPERSELPPH